MGDDDATSGGERESGWKRVGKYDAMQLVWESGKRGENGKVRVEWMPIDLLEDLSES